MSCGGEKKSESEAFWSLKSSPNADGPKTGPNTIPRVMLVIRFSLTSSNAADGATGTDWLEVAVTSEDATTSLV